MIKGKKIGSLFLFLMIQFITVAQTEQGLIPFSNKLLLNPSYAGWNKNTRVWSSLQYSSLPSKQLNNTFTLTYDTWSEKMKGGIAVCFYQGLIGKVNTNITGTGLTYSKPFKTGKRKQIIPSLSLNLYTATKQWFVLLIDEMLDKQVELPTPPGTEFNRYHLFNPRTGLLWNTPNTEFGFSVSYFYQHNLLTNEKNRSTEPLYFLFHLNRKKHGHRKGLISQPFMTRPELDVLFSKNILLSRAGFRTDQVNHIFGLFVENNYNENIYGISAMAGLRLQNFQITLATGAAYSFSVDRPAFFGEINLGLVISYINFEEQKPWTPLKKLL